MIDTNALHEIALRAAARNDESSPTGIHWVLSSRARIADLVGWGLGAADDGSREQILLVVTGHFTVRRHRMGAQPPTGTVLTVVMDHDFTITDFGCREEGLDVAPLGEIHSIPVG